jgi:PAS domain S-box-containing protein/putative nucleotidyltransferase with HDIG domain
LADNLGSIVAGENAEILTWVIRDNLYALILGSFLILFSLFALLLLIRPIGKKLAPQEMSGISLPFGLSALCAGAFLISRSPLMGLILPAESVWSFIEAGSLCLFPVWAVLLFERLLGAGPLKLVRRIWQAHAMYLIAGSSLVFFGRVELPELFPPLAYLMTAAGGVLAVLSVISAFRGCTEARIFAAGLALAALFCLLELLFSRRFADWGLFFFVSSLAFLYINRGIHIYREINSLVQSTNDVIYRWRSRPSGGFDYINPAISALVGYTPKECRRNPQLLFSICHTEDLPVMREAFSRPSTARRLVLRWRHKNGSLVWTEHHLVPVRNGFNGPEIRGIARDVTERAKAEQEVRTHLHRLSALRAIDVAIAGSVDLSVSLGVLVDHVTDKLDVDAADILLLSEPTGTLEFAAGRGFRSLALRHTRLRLGDGFAGKAALEQRIVRVDDMRAAGGSISRSPMIAEENFVWYCATPLIAKGNVKGVLEIFHRTPIHPDRDWLEFLQALAGQAAIAIDNATLLHSIQQSNLEMRRAYDDTIEGWSRALDLRDRETEGHTKRVTQTTLRLARLLDVADAELVHIYRGALLHDIGKMAIPDAILLKPSPLTREEWEIMRNHPAYAYDMLSRISFLQPAISIPYCHHERWDGTGYPRGIAGESIPIAARLFSVVDVWDALTSDRPYRSAWPCAKAMEHLRAGAGTHFDPRIIDAFFTLDLNSYEGAGGVAGRRVGAA